jgi:hypothetical protein
MGDGALRVTVMSLCAACEGHCAGGRELHRSDESVVDPLTRR